MPAPRPLNRWVTGHARGAFANLRAPVPWPHMWVCGTAAALPIVVGLARGELRFAIYGGLAGYLMAINDHYGALRHRLLVTALSFAALVAAFVLGLQSRGSPEIFLPILGGLTYWLGLMAGSGAEAERLLLFALIDVVVVHAAPTMTAAVGPHVWPYGLLALGTLVVGQLGSDRFGRAYRSENYARLAAAFRAAWVGPGPRHVHAVNVTLATLGAAALTEYSQVERGYWMIITVLLVMRPVVRDGLYRLMQRAVGTVLGVIVGDLLILVIDRDAVLVAGVFGAAFAVPFALKRNYWLVSFFATILVVLFMTLPATGPRDLHVPFVRVLVTLYGCAIAGAVTLISAGLGQIYRGHAGGADV